MIQPVSYSNTNFKGQMQVSMKNNSSKGIEEILSKIPEEEDRVVFAEKFDSFKKDIEEKTPDDAKLTLEMEYDDWYAGGVLKSGKSVSFEIRNAGNSGKDALYKGELPILTKEGKLWKDGEGFAKELSKFFNRVKRTTLENFGIREAIQRARTPKEKPKKSLLDKLS